MRILFCIGNLLKGGAERVAANLCNYLISENAVTIVLTQNKKSVYEIDKKIEMEYLDEGQKYNNFILKNFTRINKLIHIIKEKKPDIIISFLPEPSYRVLFLKLFNPRLKVIVSVRNDPRVEYKSKISKFIMKILYPLADGFVFQTQEAKEYFSKKIQKNSIVIPNPINKDFLCEPYNGEREKNIVTVGRLEKQKNHKLLIQAFSKLPKEFQEYKLIIYGEGSLRNELQEQINTLGLENRIIIAGQVEDVKKEIYKASVFVLSSDYEGMPNALMEAMALGIPCISTDCPCGGPKFLIKNGYNGYLVPVNNIEELSKVIKEVLENNQIDISKNANKIIEDLNPSKINKKWQEYITEIVRKEKKN